MSDFSFTQNADCEEKIVLGAVVMSAEMEFNLEADVQQK